MIKRKIVQLLILLAIPSFGMAQNSTLDTIRVFYLGGQSNMDGYGYSKDLPDSLQQTFKDIYIFHGNPVKDNHLNGGIGKWEVLQAGHGAGFSSDGIQNKLSNRFGVELSFAKKMQALYPNDKIAIIKYSKGGTSIDAKTSRKSSCWEPDYKSETGINQYDNFLATVRNALKVRDIDADGKEDYLLLSGIVWMQGESDAHDEDVAMRYDFNLKRLMDLIRASFRNGDLPVVLGKISDSGNNAEGKVWECGELVQYAQEKFASSDENAGIVRSTKSYDYSDKWHYNSAGFIDLGVKFAEEMHRLMQQN
ncbi:sialate O-acetylesterase [Marinifilum sp. RC60d5]|uniref:sialate O-acetylesterase n=1 Tax=Marinifilum sp. RC60d5 TaxID=3458414 RepID=UPI0040359EBA